nr:MAG TPA: hypothetical protein [Bacteriophage sp.]
MIFQYNIYYSQCLLFYKYLEHFLLILHSI